jgi:fucose 4-O-acetylase-like acetyltransferase
VEPSLSAAPARGRWLWLDALKGIGIIAVVIGHVIDRDAARMVFLWHMPLFFFVAGLVLKPDADGRRFAREKALRLLVPYAVFLVLLSGPDVRAVASSGGGREWLAFLASRLAGGKTLYGWLAAFWFVTCLYLTQLVVNACVVRWQPRTVSVLMLAMLVLAYANQWLLPRAWLPWGANVVLFAAPVVYLGVRLRPHLDARAWWLALPVAAAALVLVFMHLLDAPDMKYSRYGTPVLALVLGMGVVAALVVLSRRWLDAGFTAVALAKLGEASMLIMFLHMAIQQSLDEQLGVHAAWLRIVIALVLPVLMYAVLARFDVSRRLLLGLPPTKSRTAVPASIAVGTSAGPV